MISTILAFLAAPFAFAPQKEKPHQRELRTAADLIRKHGLAKFIREDADGSLCIHGAIAMARTGNAFAEVGTVDNLFDSERIVLGVLNSRGLGRHEGVCSDGFGPWNNRPERTAEDVIQVLEEAARA